MSSVRHFGKWVPAGRPVVWVKHETSVILQFENNVSPFRRVARCTGIDINVLCIRLRIPQGVLLGAGHGTDIDDAWVSMQWHQVKSTTGCGNQTGADTHCLCWVQITWAFCSACAYVLDTWNSIPFMCIYLNVGPVSQKKTFHHSRNATVFITFRPCVKIC